MEFSDSVKEAIRQAIQDIPIPNPPWRWVATSTLHMTLKFLGETPEEGVPALIRCAEAVCQTSASCSIRLGRLGGFPNLLRPRVLFYQVEDGAAPLELLALELEETLSERLKIARAKRPFRAHATIARIKTNLSVETAERLKKAPALVNASQTVQNLSLIESELHPEGARYHRVKEFALAKSK